jgi:hypothetical protein
MKEKIEIIASKRGYIVTEEGLFLNPKGKEIGSIDINGYLKTSIRVDKKSRKLLAHRLQAYQKYSGALYLEGVVSRHKNGNSLDNSWENILIGTQSDNMMDIPEQIRVRKAKHATSFIRKYNKEEVRAFHKKENSYFKTMEHFNISSKGTLHYILND